MCLLLECSFHKNKHVLPEIRIYLVNYKKSCWKPLQTLKPPDIQYSVTLGSQRRQTQAREDGHHRVALHPEPLHLPETCRQDIWLTGYGNRPGIVDLTNTLCTPSCLCPRSLRSCLRTSPVQFLVALFFNFPSISPFQLDTRSSLFWIYIFVSILWHAPWTPGTWEVEEMEKGFFLLYFWGLLPSGEAPLVEEPSLLPVRL